MRQKILLIGFVSLALGLIFDLLFYGKQLGVSVFLYCGILLGCTFWLSMYHKQPLGKSVSVVSVAIMFFAAMVFVRDNGFLTFLNVISIVYLLLIIAQLAVKPRFKLKDYTEKQYFGQILLLPLAFMGELFTVIRQLLDGRTNPNAQKQTVAPIIRGVLISLPFLFLFMLLFSSADQVFKQYIGSLFDFSVSPDLISHLMLIGFVSSLFCGAYAFIFTRSSQAEADEKPQKWQATLGVTESSIVLGSVAFLFLIFVLIQITYLFGGQSHLLATGVTYAEYARKGFFELVVVAVISLLLLLVINKSTVREKLQHKVIFMWLSGVLVAEVLVIMLSAHKRLSLYEQAYGFTMSRLFSHLFIGWLAVIFVLLLVHIMRDKKENLLAFQIFVTVVGFMVMFNLINPDGLIATKNIDRFNKVGKIDTNYLKGLSADATPATIKLLNNPNQDLQKTIAQNLYFKYEYGYNKSSPWQSSNLSRNRAKNSLFNNLEQLRANKDSTTTKSFE